MTTTRDYAEILRHEIGQDQDLAHLVELEDVYAHIAMQIFEARKRQGLTQKQLAEKVGTHQPVISRIEDADYDGHTVSLLQRIAEALGLRLRVEFYAKVDFQGVAGKATFTMIGPRDGWVSQGSWEPHFDIEPVVEVA